MDPIYEESGLLGNKLKVYQDRVIYKAGYLSPEQVILTKHVVSVTPTTFLGQVALGMAGGEPITIATSNKKRVSEAVLSAINGTSVTQGESSVGIKAPRKPVYKKLWFWIVVPLTFLILIGVLSGDSQKVTPSGESNPTVQPTTTSKEDAIKDFDELMSLSEEAGLVTSYEMSANVSLKVYVGAPWYALQVQAKKDFLAKLSTLQQSIYGRHRLEVRDARSNEKVGEVTALSGAIEIYK
jgi:hypothetical protein